MSEGQEVRDPWYASVEWKDICIQVAILFGCLVGAVALILLFATGAMQEIRKQNAAEQNPAFTYTSTSAGTGILTDNVTGCQYIREDYGVTVPRLGPDGRPMCGRPTTGATP